MAKAPGVIGFIEKQRGLGMSDSEITHALLDAGWSMDIIRHALHGKHAESPNMTSSYRRKKRSAPELLLHPYTLGAIFVGLVLIAMFA